MRADRSPLPSSGAFWFRVVVIFTIQVLLCPILAVPTSGTVLLPYVWPVFLMRTRGALPTGLEDMGDNMEITLVIAIVMALVYSIVLSRVFGLGRTSAR
jgi:hypothetical protein